MLLKWNISVEKYEVRFKSKNNECHQRTFIFPRRLFCDSEMLCDYNIKKIDNVIMIKIQLWESRKNCKKWYLEQTASDDKVSSENSNKNEIDNKEMEHKNVDKTELVNKVVMKEIAGENAIMDLNNVLSKKINNANKMNGANEVEIENKNVSKINQVTKTLTVLKWNWGSKKK